jgi:hypothetical protein
MYCYILLLLLLLLVCISTVPKYIYVENIAELLSLQIIFLGVQTFASSLCSSLEESAG